MAYLYRFIDTSGNEDFSNSVTEYWVISCITTMDISAGVMELYDFKHRMIDAGTDLAYFHATEDRQLVRDGVFEILAGLSNLRVDSVVVNKRKTAASIQPMDRFYPLMVKSLLEYPFDARGLDVIQYEKVLVFLDRAGAHRRQQETLKKAVKVGLKPFLQGVPYKICIPQCPTPTYNWLTMLVGLCMSSGKGEKPDPIARWSTILRANSLSFSTVLKTGIKKRPPRLAIRQCPPGTYHRGGTFQS